MGGAAALKLEVLEAEEDEVAVEGGGGGSKMKDAIKERIEFDDCVPLLLSR